METIAWFSIGVAVACALWIAIDEVRSPQAMGVMNVVWPVTGLYFSIFAVWAYYRVGRKKTRQAMSAMSMEHGRAVEGGASRLRRWLWGRVIVGPGA